MFIPFPRPRIPDPNFFPSRIPDPGAKKAPDPGYRSRNTAKKAKIIRQEIKLFTVPTFSYYKYPQKEITDCTKCTLDTGVYLKDKPIHIFRQLYYTYFWTSRILVIF